MKTTYLHGAAETEQHTLFMLLICIPKMNGGLTGLERYGGELMTEFSFLGDLSL